MRPQSPNSPSFGWGKAESQTAPITLSEPSGLAHGPGEKASLRWARRMQAKCPMGTALPHRRPLRATLTCLPPKPSPASGQYSHHPLHPAQNPLMSSLLFLQSPTQSRRSINSFWMRVRVREAGSHRWLAQLCHLMLD